MVEDSLFQTAHPKTKSPQ